MNDTVVNTFSESVENSNQSLITRTTLLNEGTAEAKRAEILHYFHQTFSLYESLFECLASEEAYYRKASDLRHPLIFYYGHTAVFFINKLNVLRDVDSTDGSVALESES